MAEEIQYVCNSQKGDIVSYRETFPRLKRYMAVVYETFSTSTPFPAIVKSTGPLSRNLSISDKRLFLPARMNVIFNFASINYHPPYWGADAEVWHPARRTERLVSSSVIDSKGNPSSNFDQESLFTHSWGSYMSWAECDHVCPGKNFAQVELVGASSALFAGLWRIGPLTEMEMESKEAARQMTQKMIEDSGPVLLTERVHPETPLA
ncbi:hypothetical protein MMC18_000243 [Xylographa bjoerkii]|nr:hypothetical protein [Xylographa bjoerkii]